MGQPSSNNGLESTNKNRRIRESSFTNDLKTKMIAFFIEKKTTFIELEFVRVNRSGIETTRIDNFFRFINGWYKVKN
jgi:hypothetical protein